MNTQDTVHRKSAAELRIRRVMDALEKNNMQAYYAPTCADAVKIAKELLQPEVQLQKYKTDETHSNIKKHLED